MKLAGALVLVVMISGCMGNIAGVGTGVGDGTGGGSGTGTGGGAGTGGGGVVLPADGGLPCDVAQLLATACANCHGSPLAGGAPMPLLTRADLQASSAAFPGSTEADRSLLRMRATTSVMPPAGALPAAQVDAFAAWVAAGMPEGSCAPIAVDAGPPVLTCTSNQFRPQPTPADAHGSVNMAPGLACISCHSGQNFAGQNPGGLSEFGELYQFMGTVFRSAWEKDLCSPQLGVSARVEIIDPNGALFVSLPVNAGGNFYGDGPGPMPSSWTARVVTATGTRTMGTAQTNGDCNTCHTAVGTGGAWGRIYLP